MSIGRFERLELIKLISQRILAREVSHPRDVGLAVAVINRITRCSDGWVERHARIIGKFADLDFDRQAASPGIAKLLEQMQDRKTIAADSTKAKRKALSDRTPK